MDGLSALGRFRELVDPAPIIVITAFGNLDTAVRAMEGGAFDYLVKPFDLDQAAAVVGRALESAEASAIDGHRRRATSAPARAAASVARSAIRRRCRSSSSRSPWWHRPTSRADHRRERHRQGAGRPGDPSPQHRGGPGRSCRSASRPSARA